jgi:PTS system fructose-specific IIA component/PTS system fructose-specific IIC component
MQKDSVFKREYVFLDVDVSTKEECLAFIAKKAVKLGISTSEKGTIDGFMERENEGSTGFDDGFAIPHTRCEDVIRPSVMVVKTKNGIDWPSMDGKPIVVVFALLVPKEVESTVHLKLISSLARKLVSADFQSTMLNSSDPDEIFGIVEKALNN